MEIEAWQSLVHVCQRWRNLIFGSPRRLNLQLYCTPKSPARDTLDVWPALPLLIYFEGDEVSSSGMSNIIAAFQRSDRVRQIGLRHVAGWQLEEVLAAMQVPFPELTGIIMELSWGETDFQTAPAAPVIPDSFLGGSAPRLRYFELFGISFPGLPKLLLSATHLVELCLFIPNSGYISPEAMVAVLSVLSSLVRFNLGFEFLQSPRDWEDRSLPPPNRSILPALRRLDFQGVTEYVEELVTRIDTPQLDDIHLTLLSQIGTPRLAQFINRTSFSAGDEARLTFHNWINSVELLCRVTRVWNLYISIFCPDQERQLSSLAQICNPLHSLSTIEGLYIEPRNSQLVWMNNAIDNTLWLRLLLPFTAVKNLYLSKLFTPSIAASLQELVGDRIIEVLPSLQNIFVEGLEPSRVGPLQEIFGHFVAARQLSDHPIAISVWEE